MRGTFAGGAAPFVVDLSRGHMPVAEQFLDFANVDAAIQE